MTRDGFWRWRWALVPALAAVGALLGFLVAVLGTPERRAEASVLITSKQGTASVASLLPDVRALAGGSVLAGNVRSTLRMGGSDESFRRRLHASVGPGSHVVVISAKDSSSDRARQIAQEAAVILTQLVQTRFGQGTPPLSATILDSAHVVSSGDRHVGRDILFGTLLGLLLAFAALAVLPARVAPAPAAAAGRNGREREAVLEGRIREVGRREVALARRAGEVAIRERALQTAEVHPAERAPEAEPAPARPAPEPAQPVVPAARTVGDAWNLNELERLVAARTDAPRERLEDWRTYLFFLRDHVRPDGTLPPSFDTLVEEVFGDLVVR